MSYFAKGDFSIKDSWNNRPNSKGSNHRSKSREADKGSLLMQLGKNIVEPSPDILDDHITKKVLKELSTDLPPPSTGKSEKKIPGNEPRSGKLPPKQQRQSEDNNLVTSMTARLSQVEGTCKNQRKQINEQKELIQKLKTENTILKGMKENPNQILDEMGQLKKTNAQLEQKVKDMENYLQKYGLKWVGNIAEGSLEHEKMKKDIKESKHNYRLPSKVDISTIQRRVEELNQGLASEGKNHEICFENGVHKFKKSEPLPIGFYSNGIAIKGYKFFPYKSKESLKILSDIVDGYFPYVFKAKYPDGVLLKVVEKVGTEYSDQLSGEKEIGGIIGGQEKDFQPPSKEEFLNKLPKQVIKNGKVINIRGEIEKKLDGAGQLPQAAIKNDQWEEIDGVTFFNTECHQLLEKKLISEEEICILKIRTEKGAICILEIEKGEKISSVYKWMRKVTTKTFKLMSSYPTTTYEEEEKQSLEELGFYPNGMMHVHAG